jgi:hypothetical protein
MCMLTEQWVLCEYTTQQCLSSTAAAAAAAVSRGGADPSAHTLGKQLLFV